MFTASGRHTNVDVPRPPTMLHRVDHGGIRIDHGSEGDLNGLVVQSNSACGFGVGVHAPCFVGVESERNHLLVVVQHNGSLVTFELQFPRCGRVNAFFHRLTGDVERGIVASMRHII